MSRLKELYTQEILPSLMKEFGYKNLMMVPRIEKIVLNMGVGEAIKDKKIIENAVDVLTVIAGQKAVPTVARVSIAGFKLREGMTIGAKVTLRRHHMYEFLDRLINMAMPRIRDFRGVSPKSFDGRGNFGLGIKEQIIFPEVNYERVDKIRGLDIVIVTSAKTNEEGLALLKGFNIPFVKKETKRTTI